MKRVLDFLLSLLMAIAVVGILIGLLWMQGCANLHMTDEERVACRDAADGCSVWTEQELRGLAERIGRQEYRRGWTDATKQGGRGL